MLWILISLMSFFFHKSLHINSTDVNQSSISPKEVLYLICSKDKKYVEEKIKLSKRGFHTNVSYSSHNFPIDCPCAYDKNGVCRQSPHMCTASTSNYYCNFKLSNVFISKEGGLIDYRTFLPISFSHPTIGMMPPIYNEDHHKKWQDHYIKSALSGISDIKKKGLNNREHLKSMKIYDLVVPARLLWDDQWNHISFQMIPFISHVKEWHNNKWDNITWHASIQIAAVLKLLDVKDEKIVIEKSIFARNILLPWVPGWCPLQTATLKGVAARMTKQLTTKLLSLSFINATIPISYNDNNKKNRNIDTYGDNDQLNNTNKIKNKTNSSKRLVIYLRRSQTGLSSRRVYNELELIRLLRLYLHEDYELYITGYIGFIHTIEGMHASWARYVYPVCESERFTAILY